VAVRLHRPNAVCDGRLGHLAVQYFKKRQKAVSEKNNCVRPGGWLADCRQVKDQSVLTCRKLKKWPRGSKLCDLVDLYKRDWMCCLCKRITSFANLPNLRQAIERAGNGKECDGQRRIRHLNCLEAGPLKNGQKFLLKNATELESCESFEALYTKVKCIADKPGLGEMYFYDVALRLAAAHRKRILPKEKVYLPQGAGKGAQNLNQALLLEFDFSNVSVEKRCLQQKLQCLTGLTAYEIEDFFCIFADALSSVKRQ
jgi:hypothetical protein